MGTCERAYTMSQLSKVKHSRNQWKTKATQRSDHNRYLRKQLARANDAQSVKRALEPMAGKLREDAEELRVKVLAELEAPAVPAGTPPKSPEQK